MIIIPGSSDDSKHRNSGFIDGGEVIVSGAVSRRDDVLNYYVVLFLTVIFREQKGERHVHGHAPIGSRLLVPSTSNKKNEMTAPCLQYHLTRSQTLDHGGNAMYVWLWASDP